MGDRKKRDPPHDLCSQELWALRLCPCPSCSDRARPLGSPLSRRLWTLWPLTPDLTVLASCIPNHSLHVAESASLRTPISGFLPPTSSYSWAPHSWKHLSFDGFYPELSLLPTGPLRSVALADVGLQVHKEGFRPAWVPPAWRGGPASQDCAGQTFKWFFPSGVERYAVSAQAARKESSGLRGRERQATRRGRGQRAVGCKTYITHPPPLDLQSWMCQKQRVGWEGPTQNQCSLPHTTEGCPCYPSSLPCPRGPSLPLPKVTTGPLLTMASLWEQLLHRVKITV